MVEEGNILQDVKTGEIVESEMSGGNMSRGNDRIPSSVTRRVV